MRHKMNVFEEVNMSFQQVQEIKEKRLQGTQ